MKKLHFEALEDRQMLSVSAVADFEDLFTVYGPQENYWQGAATKINEVNSFISGPCKFSNLYSYDEIWDYYHWAGFGFSRMTDTTTPGFGNQFSAFPGSGAEGSESYGVGFCGIYSGSEATVSILDDYAGNFEFSTLMVTNTTYTALSVRDGDAFTPAFRAGDCLTLIITGTNADNQAVGNVDVVLTDYRDGKNFVLNTWEQVDISSLKDAVSLNFTMNTTLQDDYGPLTPLYFAIDDVTLLAKNEIVVDFEDVGRSLATDSYWTGTFGGEDYVANENWFTSGPCEFKNNYTTWGSEFAFSWDGWAYSNTKDVTTEGYLNQYSAYTGTGANDSATYGVVFYSIPFPGYTSSPPELAISDAYTTDYEFASMEITNTTYAALSMMNGDAFAKKFTTGDWFKLTITGKDADGNELTNHVDFYLADFTNGNSYIVDQWTTVDLSSLKGAVSLEFVLTSSDTGMFGMNTPSYFAVDNITLKKKTDTPEPLEPKPGDVLYVSTLSDVDDGDYTAGNLSLREAIKLAHLWKETTEIRFADQLAGQTIVLSGKELVITTNMTIIGNGITIDADQQSRVFYISGNIDVSLAGLTITGGYTSDDGGGIYNDSNTLTVTNCTISGNTVYDYGDGGGIHNEDGTLMVTNCTISGNSAYMGGGIENWDTLAVTNSTIFGNSADVGGGINNIYGTLTVTNSTISGNSAVYGGGGIYNQGDELTLYNTIVVENPGGDIDRSRSYPGTIEGFNNLTMFDDWDNGPGNNFLYDSSKSLFVDAENGDYHLAEGSQAMDKGDNQYAYNAGLDENSLDLAGNPRFSGSSIDIGAYEYQKTGPILETPSIIVTTLDDVVDAYDGKISLREAIAYANAGDTITFAPSLYGQTIVLSGKELVITKNVTIIGNGITISADQQSRVFNIGKAVVSLSDMTIADGKIAGRGAGIYFNGGTNGVLLVTNVTFLNNTATNRWGGGVYQESGTSMFVGAKFQGNEAAYGGAICLANGEMTLNSRTEFVENTAKWGGAVYQMNGTLIAAAYKPGIGARFIENTAIWGGAFNQAGGSADLVGAVFSGNTATQNNCGGAIAKASTGKLKVNLNGLVTDLVLASYLDDNQLW